MIIRVLKTHVAASDAPAVVEVLRATLSDMHAQRGLEYVKLARRLVEDGEEIVLFEEWATPADLYRWTGGDLRRARLHADVAPLLRDLTITHYESLDRTPDELGLDLVMPGTDVRTDAAGDGERLSVAGDEGRASAPGG